ncbi:MAG: glycoside hydrolase family 127 protein [Carboxylicivirga sp.]|jgi:DUF1680 family protein|nr:glycoside hydrolase family 127 protein [Carboxylicivirga sp.]
MKIDRKLVLVLMMFFSLTSVNSFGQGKSKTKVTPIPFNEVILEDQFWLPRLNTQMETLVPFALEKTVPALENLRKCGQVLDGDTSEMPFCHRFVSSDLYKVMEGAAYLLKIEKNDKLEKQLDDIIDIIGDAQGEDGYLYVAHLTGVSNTQTDKMGETPYSLVRRSHELYNVGHLYEAAIAYYQATGKRKLLDIAEKNALHVNKVFFEGDPNYNGGKPINQAPGHQEIEMALVRMARVTGKDIYQKMAEKFLDVRSITYQPNGTGTQSVTYAQEHKPVTEQSSAVGHSVRATYMYSAMADVDAYNNNEKYTEALDRIWHNIVDTKMHITGGLGAIHGIEGFGPEYELPNKDAYNETCAAVGNVFLNYRMFLAEENAKYLDVAEIALYNNVLAGVNLDGNKFFYVNPLEADGKTPFNHGIAGRSPWFGCACCPANIARLIPQVSGLMYAVKENTIFCTLYGGNRSDISINSGVVSLKQETNYPYEGTVNIEVNPEKNNQKFDLKLRFPTWSFKKFVPGKLYSYTDSDFEKVTIKVNGKAIDTKLDKGFVSINRKWKKNDKVTLDIPMPVRLNTCIHEVEANRGRLALTRGPLVYCAEEVDNNGVVQRLLIDDSSINNSKLSTIETGKLKGITQVTINGLEVKDGKTSPANVVLTPYYAWDNRGTGSMVTWIPTEQHLAEEAMFESGESRFGKVVASHTNEDSDIHAISSGTIPESSSDITLANWNSLPQKGKDQWIELNLKTKTKLRSVSVYWHDNNSTIKVPKEWSIDYFKAGEWHEFPLYITDSYSTFKDKYNMVHPAQDLVVRKIRINMKAKTEASVGILDVLIEEEK